MCICISIDEKTRRIALSLHPLNHKRILTVVELVLFVSKCMFLSNCVVLCVVCWDTSPRRLFFHFQVAKGGESPKWEKSPFFFVTARGPWRARSALRASLARLTKGVGGQKRGTFPIWVIRHLQSAVLIISSECKQPESAINNPDFNSLLFKRQRVAYIDGVVGYVVFKIF